MRTLTVFLAFVLVVSVGCGKKDEQGSKDPGKSESGKVAPSASAQNPLIGKWQFEGSEIFQNYNSKGRLKMDLPEGAKCLGNYKAADGKVEVTYDPNQPNCMSGAMGYTLKDDNNTLDFMGAVYKRIDSNDDTSF